MNKELTVSLQDYIETIGLLIKKNKVARVKDIAKHLNVKLSSVSGALKQLKEKGYIEYSPYNFIKLTDKGSNLAESLIEAHFILKKMLKKIFLLEDEESDKISCIMEHYISENSLENIKKFVEFSEKCNFFKKLHKKYREYLETHQNINCRSCNLK